MRWRPGSVRLAGRRRHQFTGDDTTPNLRAYDVACAAGVCTLDVPLNLAPLPKLGAQIAIDKLEKQPDLPPDGTTPI
ncbi:MAG: hypothetical protein R3A10_09390 [Caldilineaceae bacterium]